jgi:hypothetical protein
MQFLIRHRAVFCVATLTLGVAVTAAWYWSQSHAAVADAYLHTYPIFYRSSTWAADFFTPAVKSQGNLWCAVALAAALWTTSQIRRLPDLRTSWRVFFSSKKNGYAALGIVVAATSAWAWAAWSCPPAMDEVFSAAQFAARPAGLCLSHYPLPNNHLFFNFLNGRLAAFGVDLVWSGRVWSLMAYASTLVTTYFFLKKMPHSSAALAALSTLAVAVQFPTWGFATQARGYEMLLLAGWLSLLGWWRYHLDRSASGLWLHLLTCAVGMWLVPTFLYWWLGLGVAAMAHMAYRRRFDADYLRASGVAATLALVGLLPALLFSGSGALFGNRYVRVGSTPLLDFVTHPNAGNYFGGLWNEWFCVAHPMVGVGLVLLPFLILFSKSCPRSVRLLLLAYAGILAAFCFISVGIRRFPFYRNLIGHAHLALLLLVVASIFWSKKMAWRRAVVAGACLLWVAFAVRHNAPRLPDQLYYYPLLDTAQRYHAGLPDLPPSSRVRVDDACFYWVAWLPDATLGAARDTNFDVLVRPDTTVVDTARWAELARCEGCIFWKKR